MPLDIRPYQSTDLDALYRICLLTGWRGGDASAHYADPLLLGDFYAAPYVSQDPGLCLIAAPDGVPSGYVLGTADSAGFRQWTENHWFPALRSLHPLPDPGVHSPEADLIRRLHAGYQVPDYSQDYPAHLHIDLLPCLQGRGVGRQLMNRFFDRLRERGCPAVHLGVNPANARAIAFYEKFGFHLIASDPGCIVYGFKL